MPSAGEITDNKHLVQVANEIGYPIMIKVCGGKSSCLYRHPHQCADCFVNRAGLSWWWWQGHAHRLVLYLLCSSLVMIRLPPL